MLSTKLIVSEAGESLLKFYNLFLQFFCFLCYWSPIQESLQWNSSSISLSVLIVVSNLEAYIEVFNLF